MVDLGVFKVFRVSIIATYEYFAHYTHNFFLRGERVEGSAWILHIENETAIGAGQAKDAVAIGGINGSCQALSAGALNYPVFDFIG